MKSLCSLSEACELIIQKKVLIIAGEESLLRQLPKGNWIGGSIPYFMTEMGGVTSHDKLSITVLPDDFKLASIKEYSKELLSNIPQDYPENGLSFVIIPCDSPCHFEYSENCSSWKGFYNSPIVGWISGIDLKDIGVKKPIVINGLTGIVQKDGAIVMHLNLNPEKYCQINTINLFSQGNGDSITFSETTTKVKECFVNGEKVLFSKYLNEKHISGQIPLVANYHGSFVNVSFKSIGSNEVSMYAPVFKGVQYKMASEILNYEQSFLAELRKMESKPLFACNCILNFVFAHLEGKKIGDLVGPITFGEIAYMLLNQTMVYVTIQKRKL